MNQNFYHYFSYSGVVLTQKKHIPETIEAHIALCLFLCSIHGNTISPSFFPVVPELNIDQSLSPKFHLCDLQHYFLFN